MHSPAIESYTQKDFPPEAAQTANPAQTTAIFGMK